MIYTLLISGFFFGCWMVLIQIISDYPFSIKEILSIFGIVLFTLLLYKLPTYYGYKWVVYIIPILGLLLGVFYKKSYHLLSLIGLSVLGFYFNPALSRVIGEEYIKQSPNLTPKQNLLYDPILVGMMSGLVFFFLENLVYAFYGTNTQTLIVRGIITALIHLVTGGLIGFSLARNNSKSTLILLFAVAVHFLFNLYRSSLSWGFVIISTVFCFILVGYLLQLSSRLYLVKIT